MISQDKLIDYLREAYIYAWWNSHDNSTRVGAVLVDPLTGLMPIRGTNRYPGNLSFDPKNYERPLKYKLIEHAERAVIYKAAKRGIRTDNKIMVATWLACPDCARAIVLSGIKTVYTHKQSHDMTPPRWKDDINLGIEILEYSGVSFNLIDCKIGDCTNLFDREEWCP